MCLNDSSKNLSVIHMTLQPMLELKQWHMEYFLVSDEHTEYFLVSDDALSISGAADGRPASCIKYPHLSSADPYFHPGVTGPCQARRWIVVVESLPHCKMRK